MNYITNKSIQELNPCKDGIDDFNEKYPDYNDTLSNLLQLEDISYDNKVWLVCKVVDVKILQQWPVKCAESVAHIYNDVYPNDNRINDCIEMTKRYLNDECSLDQLNAASDAAYAAYAAARYAAYAAADAASDAAYAAYAASDAARNAAYAARNAASDQENINLSILIALLEDL